MPLGPSYDGWVLRYRHSAGDFHLVEPASPSGPLTVEQALAYPDAAPNISFTTTSWTPGANNLLLACAAYRGGSTPTLYAGNVTGNGLTWVRIIDVDDTQGAVCLSIWRAMGTPTAGGVTFTYNNLPITASYQLIEISGTITTGANGADAIGATNGANTGATDTTTPSVGLTTTAANSWVFALGAGRNQAWSVTGAGHTAILLNQISGAGGDTSRSHTSYKEVVSPGAATMDFTQGSATDWAVGGIEILKG